MSNIDKGAYKKIQDCKIDYANLKRQSNYIYIISEESKIKQKNKSGRYKRFYEIGKLCYKEKINLEDVLNDPEILDDFGFKLNFESQNDISYFKDGFYTEFYYDLGNSYGIKGCLLENIPEEFVKNDSDDRFEMKKISYFEKGYKEGLLTYCYNLGLNGIRIEDIPIEFTLDRQFLREYQKGLVEYQEAENNFKTR